MSTRKKLGIDFGNIDSINTREDRIQYINFKLASLGLPIYRSIMQQTLISLTCLKILSRTTKRKPEWSM